MNDFRESSTLSRMQERYWTTKQAVCKKLGKKDDDCIIASDAELDAKLELFQNIEESFFNLMRVLENYQDKLCVLAQEENAMGRFLKENGKYDKTRAGKVMIDAGKALSFSAQQKLSLRLPLVRLYHEVETFQYRAIVDTMQTVEKMEKARTAYRGALMWMKDVSQQLDPDTCKQLEKFRKVQSNVRISKGRFDKLKLDTLQKVDLLSFSRCNLFSQALASYQNTLISISKKIAHTVTSVAETTKGYQHYEFSVLKDLTETSRKVAEDSSENGSNDQKPALPSEDKDVLLFFESEYCDEDKRGTDDSLENNANSYRNTPKNSLNSNIKDTNVSEDNEKEDVSLVNIDSDILEKCAVSEISSLCLNKEKPENASKDSDLLTGVENEDVNKNDLELLQEILDLNFSLDSSKGVNSSQSQDFENFSVNQMNDSNRLFSLVQDVKPSYFMPSQLIDMTKCHPSQIDTGSSSTGLSGSSKTVGSDSNSGKKGKQDMSSWYNLFADLDPVANPDLIGKKSNEEFGC